MALTMSMAENHHLECSSSQTARTSWSLKKRMDFFSAITNTNILKENHTAKRPYDLLPNLAPSLQTLSDDLGDVGFGEGHVGLVEAFVERDVLRHLGDAALVDSQIAQVHGDADALEERVGGVDRAPGNLGCGQFRIDSEDVHAVFHESRQGALAQDLLHPARRDDGQAPAMGNVVIGAQGVLDRVAGPSGGAVAQRQDSVAAVGAGQHHLGARGVVVRVRQALAAVLHQAAEHGFAETVVQQGGVGGKVLLHHVVHGVRDAGCGLAARHGEGIDRIQDGDCREEVAVQVADLVVGFRARDHAAAVVFAAGGGQLSAYQRDRKNRSVVFTDRFIAFS